MRRMIGLLKINLRGKKQVPKHQAIEVDNFFLAAMVDGEIASFFPGLTSSARLCRRVFFHIYLFQE